MRLLIVTQVVDPKHSVLGFFHGWITEIAKHLEHVEVICLQEGAHALPGNVTVSTLGKKEGNHTSFVDRLRYSVRFFRILLKKRGSYDAILVHMNQEYILLAGWYWLLMGMPIYLWRNHYAGSIFTNIAAAFCTKVFCTSRYSYAARFKKAVIMPVGTDAVANPEGEVSRVSKSILSLGRISPSKNIHTIIEAFGYLHARGVSFSATVRGKSEPDDVGYLEQLRTRVGELGMGEMVTFGDAVPKSETNRLYRAHEIFINASPSGMLDKTIFSASAYGCLVLVSSKDVAIEADPRCIFEEGNAEMLAAKLEVLLALPDAEKGALSQSLRAFAARHSLAELGKKLREEIAV